MQVVGPQTEAADLIDAEKYRGTGESFREKANRVAASLQDDHEHYMAFRETLLTQRFLPAGRVQAAMGSLKITTPYNCFVSATIHDSFVDGPSEAELAALLPGVHPPVSIMKGAENAASTMRQGGGIGYDFSTLRPSGDFIRGVQAQTDGPMAFTHIYDAVCRATSSAGNRRGAQMLVLRCDHPDIEAFIRAKQVAQEVPWEYRPLRGFNMSVGVTDELMECVAKGTSFPLRFNGEVYRHVDAQNLWEMIMRATYDWAEPGVLFLDTINRMNNLWYCEYLAATNPCGEQPLPPHGACLLGSFNLVKYLIKLSGHNEFGSSYEFDFETLKHDIPWVVRAMDNIVNRARYPLPEQRSEAFNKRRMGLGVTGLANAIEALGAPYGSPDFILLENTILHFINRHCYIASSNLAKEKGSFPLYDRDKYAQGHFIQSLDQDVQDLIYKQGIRNSHLTSIAPTGTISFSADNVSSGIEPVFSYEQERRVIMPDGTKVMMLKDYGVSFLSINGKRCVDVTPDEHVAVLVTAQKNVDSAVSKTCNVPTDIKWEDFKSIYLKAYEGGAKGCTTFRPNGNYQDVIKSADVMVVEEVDACSIDPVTGKRTGDCA